MTDCCVSVIDGVCGEKVVVLIVVKVAGSEVSGDDVLGLNIVDFMVLVVDESP